MTGRGAGWCAGYDRPGFANPAPGAGLGVGYRGSGRGWRNMYYATGLPGWVRYSYDFGPVPAQQQELLALKARAQWLSDQLAGINKRIEELGEPPPAG